MKLKYQDCLKNNGYKAGNILKKTKNSIVLKVKRNNITYVAKVLYHNKTSDVLERRSMKTEIQALKYMKRNFNNIPFYVKYVEDFTCIRKNNIIEIVVMDYVKGVPLQDFDTKKKSKKWWKSLVYQLILSMYIFADHKIQHNDLWDANIMVKKINTDKDYIKVEYKNKTYFIPNAGFVIVLVDFQYTNQYKVNPGIYSAYVMSENKKFQKEKNRLGWSSTFTKGGDLNQILGILSDYDHVPEELSRYLKEIIRTNESNNDFPYAISKNNKKTYSKFMLENINLIMDLIDYNSTK